MENFILVSVINGVPHHHGYYKGKGDEAFERAISGAKGYFESWKEVESIAVFELYAPFTKRFELIRSAS
jgi:hypothetical protein